jgi:hypothetical protein
VLLFLLTLPWLIVAVLVVAASQASSKADQRLELGDREASPKVIRARRGP